MKNRKIALVFTSIVLTVIISCLVISTSADYSATNDPLITLSYLNETIIPQLEKEITENVLANLKSEDGATVEPEKPDTTTPSVDLTGLKYTVVHLTKGQKLFANGENTESLELVLRAGEAESVSPFADQGVADLTASTQLYNGDALVKNNYCIIPRGQDGRGILITSDEAYILVRGVYEIE